MFVMFRRDRRMVPCGRASNFGSTPGRRSETLMWNFPFFPDRASTIAGRVDLVFFAATAITVFFTALICFLILFFAIRYRRGSKADRDNPVSHNTTLEVIWIGIPLRDLAGPVRLRDGRLLPAVRRRPRTPRDLRARQAVDVEGRAPRGPARDQRAARAAGPAGAADDDLAGRDPQLLHPGVPDQAGRVPGRYTSVWFEPTKAGEYHLFCAEYCGTKHSGMIGWVVVMEPAEYRAVARGGDGRGVDGGRRRAAVPAAAAAAAATARTRRSGRRCSTASTATRCRWRPAGVVHGRRALHPRLDPAAESRWWPATSR